MNNRTFCKYSVVRALRDHNTIGIKLGELLTVASCKSHRPMFKAFNIVERLSKDNFEIVSAPYKVGDEVTCIADTRTLTLGKVYKTYQSQFSTEVRVVNDLGTKVDILRSRFSLEPVR
jgi:hypothetical protein